MIGSSHGVHPLQLFHRSRQVVGMLASAPFPSRRVSPTCSCPGGSSRPMRISSQPSTAACSSALGTAPGMTEPKSRSGVSMCSLTSGTVGSSGGALISSPAGSCTDLAWGRGTAGRTTCAEAVLTSSAGSRTTNIAANMCRLVTLFPLPRCARASGGPTRARSTALRAYGAGVGNVGEITPEGVCVYRGLWYTSTCPDQTLSQGAFRTLRRRVAPLRRNSILGNSRLRSHLRRCL